MFAFLWNADAAVAALGVILACYMFYWLYNTFNDPDLR